MRLHSQWSTVDMTTVGPIWVLVLVRQHHIMLLSPLKLADALYIFYYQTAGYCSIALSR